jgi:carboxyl-terminal processing protease
MRPWLPPTRAFFSGCSRPESGAHTAFVQVTYRCCTGENRPNTGKYSPTGKNAPVRLDLPARPVPEQSASKSPNPAQATPHGHGPGRLSRLELFGPVCGCWSLKHLVFGPRGGRKHRTNDNSLFQEVTRDAQTGCVQTGLNPQIFVSIVNNRGYSPSKLLTLHLSNLIKSIVRILLLLTCLELALPLFGAETSSPTNTAPSAALAESAKWNTPVHIVPGTNDIRIAHLTARMLEQFHYLHQRFDAKISSRFLDSYIKSLDPQRMHFLQADIDEFEKYRTNLGTLTLKQLDTSPAYIIFNRFMKRLDERIAYASEVLKTETFEFNGDDRLLINRKDQPFPKDITAAKALWHERLRYEFLQEKLNKESREEIAKLIASHATPIESALTWEDFQADIVKIISRRYARIHRTFREWDSDEVLQTYLTALAHVYDPHSDYFDKAQLENFSIGMSLSLFGVGAVLTSEDGYCKINELNPSGPAAKSKKFKANDKIVAVAQGTNEPVDVVDMPLGKVVEMIRGPKGTEVRLTIIPADASDSSTRVTVSVIRDQIKLEDQQAKAKIIDMPDTQGKVRRLGVIDLPSFYASFPLVGSKDKAETKSTTTDVALLLQKLKEEKVDGVILDLRRNGGGSLEEAINLTGLFIKEGPVVQIKDPNGDVQVDEDKDPAIQYDGPLIVLTSRFSASASEILAGALQDYGRALLVGDASTHGKGTVQSLNQLAPYLFTSSDSTADAASLGALKVTTRKFYRASGSSTQLKGVIPDIILPSIDDYLEVGESSLDNPLPWDTIESANYEKLNRVKPYLADVSKKSAQRVATGRDFDYVKEDIEQVKKVVAEKSVSLNEQQRLKEKEESDVRQKIRERERKARKQPDQKILTVLLTNGVPVVVAPTNSSTHNLAASGTHPSLTTPASTSAGDERPDAPKVAISSGDNSGTGQPVAESQSGSIDSDPEDLFDVDKVPAVDVHLEETEHILVDYLELLRKETALTVNH